MGFQKKRDTTGKTREWRYYATDELLNADKIDKTKRPAFMTVLPGGKGGEKVAADKKDEDGSGGAKK